MFLKNKQQENKSAEFYYDDDGSTITTAPSLPPLSSSLSVSLQQRKEEKEIAQDGDYFPQGITIQLPTENSGELTPFKTVLTYLICFWNPKFTILHYQTEITANTLDLCKLNHFFLGLRHFKK